MDKRICPIICSPELGGQNCMGSFCQFWSGDDEDCRLICKSNVNTVALVRPLWGIFKWDDGSYEISKIEALQTITSVTSNQYTDIKGRTHTQDHTFIQTRYFIPRFADAEGDSWCEEEHLSSIHDTEQGAKEALVEINSKASSTEL